MEPSEIDMKVTKNWLNMSLKLDKPMTKPTSVWPASMPLKPLLNRLLREKNNLRTENYWKKTGNGLYRTSKTRFSTST